jgi:hypothetical protein
LFSRFVSAVKLLSPVWFLLVRDDFETSQALSLPLVGSNCSSSVMVSTEASACTVSFAKLWRSLALRTIEKGFSHLTVA